MRCCWFLSIFSASIAFYGWALAPTRNILFRNIRFVHRRCLFCSPSATMLIQGDDCTLTPLQQRLQEAGVKIEHMTLCDDEDWSRIETASQGNEEKKDTSEFEGVSSQFNNTTVEIKTLVWEVSCNHNDHATGFVDKFYIVTALKMEDKVELSLLRDLVYKQNDLPFGCTPSRLSIAPQQIAESLTGFKSGCMPPIGHDTAMKLYVDSAIADATNVTTGSIGAGVLGKSLLLPLSEFLRVAEASEKGAAFGDFVQSSRPQSPSSLNSKSREEHSMSPVEIRKQRKLERFSRQPEPKDRLKEYQQFDRLVDKAKLLRTTARKQGRVEDMKKLVNEAVSQGDFPDLFFVSTANGMDKNALHLCAWRGDFESVKYLVRTAKSLYPDLDLVNMISRGEGNYGKTPIFFALTQCREDVVRYLVAEGANLLIVNNKGQTPASIAVSHLKEDACKFIFETEAAQLKAGGAFVNYRETNSDRKLYGDLDPRFPIDQDNLGIDDISNQIRRFQESVHDALPDTVHGGMPTVFEPRSIRPTVRWWVREARSLEAANLLPVSGDGQITFTQPRPRSPRRKLTSPVTRPHSPQRKELFLTPSINSLPRLTIEEVLNPTPSPVEQLVVVSDSNTILLLEQAVDRSLASLLDPLQQHDMSPDEKLVHSVWGVDCEWKPGDGGGTDNPVATLQLSTQRNVFLVDLQVLCQDFRTNPQIASELETQLNRVLSKLFSSPHLPLLGYAAMQDFGKLAASFPHLNCFSQFSSVIDLQTVSLLLHSKSSRQSISSLKKITALLLGKRLDKEQQCSDWSTRPLSQDQIEYAMLDAAVLPLLLSTMVKKNTVVDRYNGQFFKIHASLRFNVRYTKVETPDEQHTYEVPMGTIKRALGQHIARQCWPSDQEAPALPKLIPLQLSEQPHLSKKERAHLSKITTFGTKRPKPVELKTLAGNLDNLPLPGIRLGYTKESCVFRVVGHELLNTFPEGTYVGFNRRAGVVETTNAWIVFCHFGTRPYQGWAMEGRTFSEFYKGGRQLSFRLNPKAKSGNSSEASLFQYVTKSSDTANEDKKVILFARDGTKSRYLYCGVCECVQAVQVESGATSVLFELLEFDRLVGDTRISPDFEELVGSRQDFLAQIR